MELYPQAIAILLFVSALVALITSRLKLPYSIGLVAAGIGLAFSPFSISIPFTKDLLFSILLPPLIFEAAFVIEWNALRKNLPVILTLATVGVLLSTAVTTVGMTLFAHWDWLTALLFGSLIAATDPVSVIATFKEAGVEGRLRLLVEAESLFNDGTAAVAFSLALSLATGYVLKPFAVVQILALTVLGGVAIGGLIATLLLLLAKKTEDHLVEIMFTVVGAYGSFLLAEHLHLSGILAVLTAGIILGNFGSLGAITDKGRDAVQAFWESIAFMANAFIFLLIGIREVHQDYSGFLVPILIAILLVTLGRAIGIYLLCKLFSATTLKVSMSSQHILFWGGLRGALALALALGLPSELPHRESILSVTFAVVTFSVFVQGLTITPLLKRLGLLDQRHE